MTAKRMIVEKVLSRSPDRNGKETKTGFRIYMTTYKTNKKVRLSIRNFYTPWWGGNEIEEYRAGFEVDADILEGLMDGLVLIKEYMK